MVLGVFAVVQALEGLFISPKIMGDRVGLHPLAIIIAVMTGTTLLGGILGGIPGDSAGGGVAGDLGKGMCGRRRESSQRMKHEPSARFKMMKANSAPRSIRPEKEASRRNTTRAAPQFSIVLELADSLFSHRQYPG